MNKKQIRWCVDNQMIVKFIFVHTQPRVALRCGGHRLLVERDTVEEAIDAGMKELAKRRKNRDE